MTERRFIKLRKPYHDSSGRPCPELGDVGDVFEIELSHRVDYHYAVDGGQTFSRSCGDDWVELTEAQYQVYLNPQVAQTVAVYVVVCRLQPTLALTKEKALSIAREFIAMNPQAAPPEVFELTGTRLDLEVE